MLLVCYNCSRNLVDTGVSPRTIESPCAARNIHGYMVASPQTRTAIAVKCPVIITKIGIPSCADWISNHILGIVCCNT